jgi:dihydrolipoamide dehydrogenase
LSHEEITMSQIIEVPIPDIGDFDSVDIVEVLVAPGDSIKAEDSLVTLESDKASMEVPSPAAGIVREVRVQVGTKASQGTILLTLEVAEQAPGTSPGQVPGTASKAAEQVPGTSPKATEQVPDQVPGTSPKAADQVPGTSPEQVPGTSPKAADQVPGTSPAASLPASDLHAEVLVLGAGPGGYTAAFRASDLGKQVVLVERYPILGGVCLNVGCIPSKALLHAAKVVDEAAAFAEHGLRFAKPKVDLKALRSWKDGVVGRLTGGLTTLAKQRKVRVVEGVGRFLGPHQLAVTKGKKETTISFDQCIVAAGSRVVELPFLPKDDPRIMDSTGALELEEIPGRLLILGGGIIGLEMACVYSALGSKITVVELMDSLIPGCDKDLVRPLHKRLAGRYENLYLSTKVVAVEATKKGLVARFEGAKAPASETFDRILVAVGRRPNGDRIEAEAAGITVTERGFVPVDRQQRTNVPHIFAIGDLAGQPMLAHKAIHEGKVAAEVAAGHPSSMDARVIPSVAYTDPEVAWVGLTETQAKAEGRAYEKGSFPWAASGRSLALGRDEGLTKLLFDPETRRILGAGVVGPGAGDLIAETALAIEMDCEAADIGLTVHPHPTLSETVAMAAEAFEGTLTDLYLPKKR